MELKINGEVKEFIFGIKFIRELDKKFFIDNNGMKFGAGLSIGLPQLYSGNSAVLSDVLYAATTTEKKRPSLSDLDDYIDGCKDIESLFESVLEEIESSNAGKLVARQLKESMEKSKEEKAL